MNKILQQNLNKVTKDTVYVIHRDWQTKDVKPEYPRVHKFLNFWHDNIDAVISEVMLCDEYETSYRPVKEFYNG